MKLPLRCSSKLRYDPTNHWEVSLSFVRLVTDAYCWQTIVEYERLLIGLGWWDPDEKDKKKFPRYMVIAQETKGEVLSVADGVTGRIRKHLAASASEVTAHVDDKMDALKNELDIHALKNELLAKQNELLEAIASLSKSK